MVDTYLEMLMQSVKSENTRANYARTSRIFLEYTGLKNGREVVSMEPKRLTELIIEYILHLKNKINLNTVETYLFAVKSFCEINDIELKWKKIKKFYPQRIKISGQSAYSSEDIKKMLAIQKKLKNRALIHFLASTGCRAGSIESITLGNLRDMPYGCQMVTVYAGYCANRLIHYRNYVDPLVYADPEETKKKQSASLKGKTPWNKEKTGVFSEKTRRGWSEKRKGRTS